MATIASTISTENERVPKESQNPAAHSPVLISCSEEMNPAKRSSMEDCSVYHPPGSWNAPDKDMAYLGVYDGHGGTTTLNMCGVVKSCWSDVADRFFVCYNFMRRS